MSSDEFGFSDEPAAREDDPFAGMSEEEFNLLLNISTEIMEARGIESRAKAVELAKHVVKVQDMIMTGSGRAGIRKYGEGNFRHMVIQALVKGEVDVCIHGHISTLTECTVCKAQARIDKHVKNPVSPSGCTHGFIPFEGEPCPDCEPKPHQDEEELHKSIRGDMKRCTHTRIDVPAFDPNDPDQAIPPCPACRTEEDELLEHYLNERQEYDEKMGLLGTHATKPIAQPIDKLQGNEAEKNAIIAILLDKLGGETELDQLEIESIAELTRKGMHTYSIEPTMHFGLTLRRIGPSGVKPFEPGRWFSRTQVHTPNPSRPTDPASTEPPRWSEDEEDLPF